MWTNRQLAEISTPAVTDARGVALLRTVRDLLVEYGPQKLHVQSAQACPAEFLPALIAERSMEEFIDPELPEQIKRDILDQEYPLKRLKGYDEGVMLGMALLGYIPEIIQWHEQDPKAAPNTHILKVSFVVADGAAYTANDIRAIHRMNNACKRWSQDTELRLGVVVPDTRPGLNAGLALQLNNRIHIEPHSAKSLHEFVDAPVAFALQINSLLAIEEVV